MNNTTKTLVETAYRAGVMDACKEVAPAADMEDHELTEYGKDMRRVSEYAYRNLTSPALLANTIARLIKANDDSTKSNAVER